MMNKILIYLLQRKPIRMLGWGFVIYFFATLVVNPFIMAMNNIGFIQIYKDPVLAIWSHTLSLLILIFVSLGYIFFTLNQERPKERKSQLERRQIQVNNIEVPDMVRDITNGVQVSYLKNGSSGEEILVGDKSAKLYHLSDLSFDFQTTPHCLLVGETGSGKSIASYNLLQTLNKKFHYPAVVLMDAGNQDFENAIYETEDIMTAFDHLYYIIKGRQMEPVGTAFPPLLVVLEEAETFMRTVNTTLSKKDYDHLIMKVANMILVARKLNVNFLFLAQTAKAIDLPSEIRGQFGNRFYLRLNKTAARMYSIPYQVHNLPSGVCYYEKIDAFVQFDNIEKAPHLNKVSMLKLSKMASRAKRKHGIKDFTVD